MDTVRLDSEIWQTTAPNGVVVCSERVPTVRSAAIGIWVRSASVHEDRAQMGVSHLLEHMVFKGTERRSAQEIALALEVRGGSLDAYTSRDSTAFQARVLDADLPEALDVLTDLVRHPLLRAADLELERKVVLEEISTVDDTPDDLIFDLSAETLWPEHPYGFSILGTRETVGRLSTKDLGALHARAYHPSNCVIAAAGNLTHEQLLTLVERQGWFEGAAAGPGQTPASPPPVPAVRGGERRERKDSAQTHLVFASDTVPFADRRKYAILVLANILGGGMSSRLFQRVREELGLAYAVYAYTSFYRGMGTVGVYVGTQPATGAQAAEAIAGRVAHRGGRGASGGGVFRSRAPDAGLARAHLVTVPPGERA